MPNGSAPRTFPRESNFTNTYTPEKQAQLHLPSRFTAVKKHMDVFKMLAKSCVGPWKKMSLKFTKKCRVEWRPSDVFEGFTFPFNSSVNLFFCGILIFPGEIVPFERKYLMISY